MGVFAQAAKRLLDQGHYMSMRGALLTANGSNNLAGTAGATGADGKAPSVTVEFSYDSKLEGLKDQVHRWIRDLLQDVSASSHSSGIMTSSSFSGISSSYSGSSSSSSSTSSSPSSSSSLIRQVLLKQIMVLCRFFGQESTLERLLPQLFTFLNEAVRVIVEELLGLKL